MLFQGTLQTTFKMQQAHQLKPITKVTIASMFMFPLQSHHPPHSETEMMVFLVLCNVLHFFFQAMA